MSVKPLNLSIMIGDSALNGSPHSTPRRGDFRSISPTKSCVKTRIATLTSPVSMKPNNKFRQWADPPPPPSRSRTSERKINPGLKRRPGSVDSRFRRTLTEFTKVDNSLKKKTLEEIKTEFLFSSRELKLQDRNENNTSKMTESTTSDLNKTENLSENETKTKTSEYKSIYKTLEPPIGKYKVNELENTLSVFDYSEQSASEIFNNHKTPGCKQLKSKPFINVESILLNEPQTELMFGKIADNFSQTDISISSKIRYDDKSSSDIFELREDESYISEVYSNDSQETLESVENYICKKCSLTTEKINGTRYLRYLEIWSTLLTLGTLGALTWVFVVPFMEKYATDFYFTYINPKPEPSNRLIDFLRDFYNFIEDVLSTPSHSRIRYFK